MRLPSVSLAIALLLMMTLGARAQPFQGLYVGAGAGYNLPQNVRTTPLTNAFGSGSLHLDEGGGFAGVGSVGYALGNGFRFEVEGSYRNDGLRQLNGTPFPTAASGNVRMYGAMANALFDMDVGVPWLFPYIGAGVGYQWTNLHGVSAVSPTTPFSFATDDTQGAFAWQVIAGLSFPIPRLPGLSLTSEYRFTRATGGEKFDGTIATAAGTTPATIKLGNQNNNSFLFGVRYAFNVAAPVPVAPAPQAAPAPAAARSYLVFFDWDKATLSDRARQIIKEAAQNSTSVQYTRIEVNGYTDTSGTPAYNKGLSLRRARAVQVELVRDGVPQSAITIQGLGDTHLLVQTGPGVREPQNRRVEIIIH
jgi:outer membrane protein OmpA-like peptidoglycan-associated protein